MADATGIAWCDATFNPWIGCTKVGPGCDHCYAEAWNARFNGGTAVNWGPGAPRRRTSVENWNKVRKWNRESAATGKRMRVFCASLADVFDNEVPAEWRSDLWSLIDETPALDWIIVTKRVGNVLRMVPIEVLTPNVILLATIVNQAEADRDLPKLVNLRGLAWKIGISCEPMLEPINFAPFITAMDWLIIGGESSQGKAKARPFDINWASSAVDQCSTASVPIFIKQLGSNPVDDGRHLTPRLKHRAGGDPSEWPEALRVRQFPRIGG